jgi:hypothetical protein
MDLILIMILLIGRKQLSVYKAWRQEFKEHKKLNWLEKEA